MYIFPVLISPYWKFNVTSNICQAITNIKKTILIVIFTHIITFVMYTKMAYKDKRKLEINLSLKRLCQTKLAKMNFFSLLYFSHI